LPRRTEKQSSGRENREVTNPGHSLAVRLEIGGLEGSCTLPRAN
jgi:hypothetical protein